MMEEHSAARSQFLEAEAATSRGRKHAVNEDSYTVNLEAGLFAVADGMGGHRDGHIASGAIISLLEHALDGEAPFEQRIEMATQAIQSVNNALHDQTLAVPGADISGSTVVAVIIDENYACCLWAGDSRLYLFRNNCLYLISEDHVGEGGVLTRAVGSSPRLEVDRRIIDVRDRDVFLLCSDGLLKGMSETAVAELLGSEGHAPVDRLLAKSIAGGSADDVTAILVWVGYHER
ncbi:PP2C family protein-serine/threonine phosphatase [Rhizobium mayense]|uniref:Protein phosphatase 2C domain-containing protein n=1 Tax=Rhizobium mayense TaxID=1312184 RepID=A0ABT7JUE6_9HYPH|nr:protein phosphatase 2C domain-containing protein [Rhizobium mayense]MDL2398813.1 protein phosphatase 2C domain-containing protein [Rhizobium mayense]